MKSFFSVAMLCTVLAITAGAQQPLGIFSDHQDIGEPDVYGEARYEDGMYILDAVGATIGRRSTVDQFHYVFKEIEGSFSIQAFPENTLPDGEGGLMIRQDLDPDSVHASFLRVGDVIPGGNTDAAWGTVFPHTRTLKGGGTIVDGDVGVGGYADNNASLIRLERVGNSIRYYTMNTADAWVLSRTEIVPMTEKVYVGLAATANSASALGEFEFRDVEIEEYPLWVGRSIPVDTWTAGEKITVTLTAKARGSLPVNGTVNEIVPKLATIGAVNASVGSPTVDVKAGAIKWNLTGLNGAATLTYEITLPNRDAGTWQGTFNDGAHGDGYIGGDTILPKNPTFRPYDAPVQLDPTKPVILQAERGLVNPDAASGWLLMAAPHRASGVVAMANLGANTAWLSFPIHVPAGYGDIYIFGAVRGDDGNSDSFFTNIGDAPQGNDDFRWDFGSGNWHTDWVNKQGTNRQDPRVFSGIQGDTTVYVACREDSAVLDWIAITNDATFSPNSLDEVTGEVYNPLNVLQNYDTQNLGIFDASMDIFDEATPANNGKPGGAGFDAATGEYVVIGSGNDVWNTADNFHFLYRQQSGDFVLDADLTLDPGTSTDAWVKGLLMARQELDAYSVNFANRARPDGQYSSQWRPDYAVASVGTPDDGSRINLPTHNWQFRLERIGNQFNNYYKSPETGEYILVDGQEVIMTDPIYVGLAVTAHQVPSLSIGYFKNIHLTVNGQPVPVLEWSLY
ncbi:MAG: hypothetical protein RBU29_01315 [bacterium]|jgi:hypothetical protein|nr:hypothetical protein [bacterium]